MNNHSRTWAAWLFAAALLLVGAGSALAAVRYVDVNNAGAMWPYTSWATAASGIQEAINDAVAGDEIVVTNGTYSVGGGSTLGQPTTTNRVVVDKPLALRSVNGPQSTIIDGRGVFRCVYLTNGASLSGFTLTNGFASGGAGGGVFCESVTAALSNCVVAGNSAGYGGGAYGGTLNNCTLSGNFARFGGGTDNATLNNCVVKGNSAFGEIFPSFDGPFYSPAFGGGVYAGTLNNCILSDNRAEDFYSPFFGNHPGSGGGAWNAALNNCTLTGNSAGSGGGASGGTLNNCIVYFNTGGGNYDSSSTLNYSCTTPQPTNGVGNITNEPAFVNLAAGNYRLRPDSPCIDAGTNLSASITNDLDGRPRPLDGNGDGLAAFDMGAYEYRTPLLVWQDSPNPTPPHTDWATAAHTIQDAVDAARAGDEVVVTNGVYGAGERTIDGVTTNRVAVDKVLTLRSVNGPEFTIIQGGLWTREEIRTIRCVYLANGASLSGFTLTNGYAPSGAGLLCEGTASMISNCVFSGNSAVWSGGGAFRGTLNNCTLTGNGAAWENSRSTGRGGAVFACTLNNCTVNGNWSENYGGGAYGCTLNNCTLIGNSGLDSGGGAYGSTLNNCIVYDSTWGANCELCTLNYSCTTPLPTNGVGNITNAPLFVDQASGNLRLQSNSPCINAGLNAFAPAGPDLEANPRIVGGTVDLGAYEFQSPASIISYAWLQQYALPTDGSADSADPDGDGLNNWKEWRCATDPTNALSALRLLAPATGGTNLIVTWQSVTGVNYFLERSTAVSSAFTPVTTSIPGQPGTTTYTDTNAIGAGPWFYRVRVIVWPQEQPCLGPSPGPEYICVEGVWTHNGDGRL